MKLLKVHVLRGDTTEEEIILELEVKRNTETVTVAREVGQVNVVHILAVTVISNLYISTTQSLTVTLCCAF